MHFITSGEAKKAVVFHWQHHVDSESIMLGIVLGDVEFLKPIQYQSIFKPLFWAVYLICLAGLNVSGISLCVICWYYVLCAMYYVLCATCYVLHASCYVLHTACYVIRTTYDVLLTTYYVPRTMYYALRTTYYVPRTTYYVPCTTYQVLRTMYYVLKVEKRQNNQTPSPDSRPYCS